MNLVDSFKVLPQQAPCKFFGSCGGCNIQNIANHGDYKLNQLKIKLAIFQHEKFKIHPLFQIKENTRRRVNFKVINKKISFSKSKSNEKIMIDNCLLLVNEINNLILPLNQLFKKIKANFENIALTSSDTGIDILFCAKEKSNLKDEILLQAFAKEYKIARICWKTNKSNPYTLISLNRVALRFNDIFIDLPINSFLQVSKESNLYMNEVILNNLIEKKKTLELFAGVGSFTIEIQKKCNVTAVEGDEEAIEALTRCASIHGLRISTQKRDLFQTPCDKDFLNKFEQVVINPPRNGATPQILNLSKATNIKRIILVSCSVDNFIRDAKHLINSNYRLSDIFPIDQFLYSEHMELIAIFNKDYP